MSLALRPGAVVEEMFTKFSFLELILREMLYLEKIRYLAGCHGCVPEVMHQWQIVWTNFDEFQVSVWWAMV